MDKLDHCILARLARDARLTNAELARELKVAPSTMLERIRRLEERGVLLGYQAKIEPAALGLGVSGYIAVTLARHDEACITHFEQGVQSLNWVRSCHHLTGRFDYLLRVVARDLTHLGELIKSGLASIEGIGQVETFLCLSEIKADDAWPLPDEEA